MSESETNGGEDQNSDFEAYEEKMDELNEGLLKAYAAGFAKAKEVYDIETGGKDVRSLMDNKNLSESHYYFWEGRTKPMEFWLREQFGLNESEADEWPHFGTKPGLEGDK